ncbi:hypothetical protein BHU61_10650 [Macrococcus epidermidis]|uniref:Uncharacterized protein n=1 Tax=Macrococcus epidermidis TaxID=1902580 RepID=A0A327ZSL1_9STAP|nr:hypothetical protein [Macrococcus epidermidis]RAK43998.1 hypothetical protein BHU61_10650 [Macrococcus epidermidis]
MGQTAIQKYIEDYLDKNPEKAPLFKKVKSEVNMEVMIFKRKNRLKRFSKIATDKSNFKNKNKRK